MLRGNGRGVVPQSDNPMRIITCVLFRTDAAPEYNRSTVFLATELHVHMFKKKKKREHLNRIPEIARTCKSQELCQRLKVSINSPIMLNLLRS